MHQTFDTTPLSHQLSLSKALAEIRYSGVAFRIGFTTLLLVTFVPLLILVLVSSQTMVPTGALFFVIMLSGAGLYGLSDLYSELNEIATARYFAEVNGMKFYRDLSQTGYPGTPFRVRIYVPYTMRSLGENFIEFGQLRPDWQSRRSHGSRTQTFLRFKLPVVLPHMVLRSRKSETNVLDGVGDSVKLKLEGQFGDMFDLYVPKGYERDALYVFTPDVMERFMDATPNFDCEIIGDELYLYSSKKIMFLHPQNFVKLITIFNYVMHKFARQSSKYHDDRIEVTRQSAQMKLRVSPVVNATLAVFGLLIIASVVLHLVK